MKRIAVTGAAGLVAALGLMSCGLFRHDVRINLRPDGNFTIRTRPPSTRGVTDNPITVAPGIAGKDYTDNQGKIDSTTIKSLTLTIVRIYPDNAATKLFNATCTLTNLRTSDQITFPLTGEIAIIRDSPHIFEKFDPNPSGFLTTALKNGDSFTVETAGEVDTAPAHLDVKVEFAVNLSVNLL
jgi:hypothetical protein